ncbi:MAG: di-trans,poly-cis-decaprenylcistransferase [Omnitrophica WOR_2 bacterium RIFCSPHIGHO2_01_FULL_52_10]|nr:MAG: di-trans,poly-cis-decaprenylcistransferase [Omnitrophica WOR_2 bacterium RIFCSPHIGHO2_01_FULL_52_10]
MTQTDNIPRHVAIIMDGNGRWAKQRHLTRTQGHAEGIKRVEEIVAAARKVGIAVLTLFTFSTENWRRPESEISMLMNMLTNVLQQKIKNLKENNIKFQVIGREKNVPRTVLKIFQMAINETKNNTGLIVNLAFNYGSRQEIIDAVKGIASAVEKKSLSVADIDEKTVARFLYTKDLPDPDLLIRTSGERRISNFLLWQLSYSELYFTDKFWPDFTKEEFEKAIADYQQRERRYGELAKSELKR